MLSDEQAEKLERAGLYRRAARRWTDVQMSCECDEMRDEAIRRRNACLSRCRDITGRERDISMAAFSRAVDSLHHRMNLDVKERCELVAGTVQAGQYTAETEEPLWMILNNNC